MGIEASAAIYQAAIHYAIQNLAVELDIDLENYDITKSEYEELLTSEYVNLLLFRTSKERKNILNQNALLDQELQLPPGNKILR